MNSKEFLSQPYKLQKRIDLGIEQAERLRSLAENGHAPFSVNGGGSGHSAQSFVETQTVRYMQTIEQVKRNTEKIIEVSALVKRAIYDINNLEIEYLLEARYLNFKDWQTIADDLHVSKNYVYRLHKRGLELVRVPDSTGGGLNNNETTKDGNTINR